MKFILSWTVKPENLDESLNRIKSKGVEAEGIKILGHWHNVNLLEGWAIVEATDEITISKWLRNWVNLNVNNVTLVIDKEELLEIIT